MAEVYEDQYGECFIGGNRLYCGGKSATLGEEPYFSFYLISEGFKPRRSWKVKESEARERLPKFVWNWENLP